MENRVLIVSLFLPLNGQQQLSSLGNIGLQNAVESVSLEPLPFSSPSAPGSQTAFFLKRRVYFGIANSHGAPVSPEQNAALRERNCISVPVSPNELDGHYSHFCKQVLWKPFHYQMPDYPKGRAFEEHAWSQYVAVNKKFADAIVEFHNPSDIIWVNDYHLMLVPEMVRKMIPDAAIGFFLHIPFPSSEIFRCLHVRKEILQGILGADLIGFQTYPFLRHFLMTCTRLLSLDSTPRGIQLENKVVKVGIFSIGINIAALNLKRANPAVPKLVSSLSEKYHNRIVLIGRDKTDVVKGVRQKMLAFELFLEQYAMDPTFVEACGGRKVVLIQVALSSSASSEQNESEGTAVNAIVRRINSRFGSFEYVPVVYLQQDIEFSHYLALLTVADACIITSLRDGMNLTSHEWIVCQEEKRSPLIISEFAGTYSSLGAALRVNPWDTQEVADAIREVCVMSQDEKDQRWRELFAYVSTHTAQNYVQKFVSEILKVHQELVILEQSHIPLISSDSVQEAYQSADKKIFFLDHDGTLIPNSNYGDEAWDETLEKSASVVALIRLLAGNPSNLVYIMSSRRRKDLLQFMGIPNVGICAENGCFMIYANQRKWQTMLTDQDLSWRKPVIDIFEYYTDRTPGSIIQQNEISVIWHFSDADASFGSWQALECQNHIQNALGSTYPITVLAKEKRLEIFPRNVNKGRMCRQILEHHCLAGNERKLGKRASFPYAQSSPLNRGSSATSRHPSKEIVPMIASPERTSATSFSTNSSVISPQSPPLTLFDFIFCIGDDRSDEFMFEYLQTLENLSSTSPGVFGSPANLSPVYLGPGSEFATTVTPPRSVLQTLQEAYLGVEGKKIVTVTVGRKSSSAKWYIGNVNDVLAMLGKLSMC